MQRRSAVIMSVVCAFILSVIGVALIYSASRRIYGTELALKQLAWLAIGLILCWLTSKISKRTLLGISWLFYGGALALLIVTLIVGVTVRGDTSWLSLGIFRVQPSEIMKICLVIILTSSAVRRVDRAISFGGLLFEQFVLVLIPVGLILVQPDAGTALVYLCFLLGWLCVLGLWRESIALICVGSVFLAGLFINILQPAFIHPSVYSLLKWLSGPGQSWFVWLYAIGWILLAILPYIRSSRISSVSIAMLSILSAVPGYSFSNYLAGYQKQRIMVFLDPYQAPLKSGYNIIQVQIAIGSGGWWGKGYLNGSQSQLGFIPELWTDFILSVAAEELGIVFVVMLFILFLLFVYGLCSAAVMSADWEGYYLCSGVTLIVCIHILLNASMCVGMIPVIGLPLPFISYGGSFLVTNWIMLGVVLTASRRRQGEALLQGTPGQSRRV
ncbi:MAG: FtsW/RodA/SpoVE family cell cycle protein [bacterium]